MQQFRHSRQPKAQLTSSWHDRWGLGRASEEALAEVHLGTQVSNSSRLSLCSLGIFAPNIGAFLTLSCPGSHAPPQRKRRQVCPHTVPRTGHNGKE